MEPPESPSVTRRARFAFMSSARGLVLIASFFGLLAGLMTWGTGETKLLAVTAKQERFVAAGRQIEWSTPDTRNAAAQVNAARIHAVFGGLLGVFLGLTGGMWRRSPRAAAIAAVAGGGLGAGLGGIVTYFVLPIYEHYRQWHGSDLAASIVLHTSLWAGIGATGGLALGMGLGGKLLPWKTAAGGLLGAICGGALFDLLGAVLFSLEETGEPISSTARTRLMARLLVAVFSAAGAAVLACQISERVGTTDRR